ncbi:SPOSA6832_03892, partial [Sporobolomyces salmonicolor]
MRSRSRGTLTVDEGPVDEDDELVQLAPSRTTLASLHPPSHNPRASHSSSGTGSTFTLGRRSSADTFKGPGSSVSVASSRTMAVWDIVKPVVTVRAEHPSVERSLDKDKKQHLTCMVTVEMPSRWPTAPPAFDPSNLADEQQSFPLPPPPPAQMPRPSSSIRSLPRSARSASPTPSSVYSAYAFAGTGHGQLNPFSHVVEDLQSRMADWKGHSPDEFGQLKLYDYVNVRKDTATREFLVYLFEEAILCVTDDKRKGLNKLVDGISGNTDKLRLKGRVYIRHVRSVFDTSSGGDLSLTITMSDDAVAEFIMMFKERTSLELWKAQIETLVAGHSLPPLPAPPSAAARGKGLLGPNDAVSDVSTSDRSGMTRSSSGFSGYSRTTSSSLAPMSSVIQEEEMDEFGRFAAEHQQSQPGYASSTSYSHRGLSVGAPAQSLAPREFTPLDLMLILSVPASGPTSLKLGIIKNSLEFVVAHVGPRTRISIVTYTCGEGTRGVLRKTPFIAVGKADGKSRLEKVIDEIGCDSEDLTAMIEHREERVNVVTACNLALDIVLQRKAKSALTGMILLNDGRDGAQKQQMDLVMARAEAANRTTRPRSGCCPTTPPAHTYDLRDALAGCIGGILSIAATNVRLHINVPEKRWFKIRKVSGTPGAIVSRTGADVDIEIGELRFGERKDLVVEVEMSLAGYGDGFGSSRQQELPDPPQFATATDAFFLAKAGINPSALDDYNSANLYDDEYDSMPDEVPLFEVNFAKVLLLSTLSLTCCVLQVNAAYRDPAAGKSISRLHHSPCLLTITVNPPASDPRQQQPPSSAPEIVRRRVELLVSDMLSRALLLMTRRNDAQAARLLEETKRIISSISATLVSPQTGGVARRSAIYTSATATTQRILAALAQDVDAVHESCLNRDMFETHSRYQAAQQAVVIRDQRAWTPKSATERVYWSADNSLWMVGRSQQWLSSSA